jgi:phosphatidylserine/phosphatidylglycerophosphate/cardiolipin synthase-like enzyme
MADFLTTSGTTTCIEELITKAKKRIVLISPYLKWSQILFERLVEADRRGVKIVIVFGKEDLRTEQRQRINQLANLSLYYYENLHAKCYFNELQLVVSSMNLHEFSERNNREMSVRVWASDRVYKDAVAEAESIIQAAELAQGEHVSVASRERARANEARAIDCTGGHCIRCKKSIPLDKERPFCFECFAIWAGWENWDFEERFCHVCGSGANTSRRYPLCSDCFRRAI